MNIKLNLECQAKKDSLDFLGCLEEKEKQAQLVCQEEWVFQEGRAIQDTRADMVVLECRGKKEILVVLGCLVGKGKQATKERQALRE